MGRRETPWCCCFLLAVSAALAAASPKVALSDARLTQLVQQFAGPKPSKSEAALRKIGLPRVLPRLQRLQQRTPKNEELYFDLAYTLAYLHVSYRQNVQRLIALDELWDRGDPRWQQYVAGGSDMRDAIPDLVQALYEHNHDAALLRILYSWGLDGAAAEILDEVKVSLLTEYPLPVLRVLENSPERADNALSALTDGVGADPKEYRRARGRIRRAQRRAAPALRPFISRFLRNAAVRWQISDGGKELRRARLTGLYLGGVDLSHADLRDADARGADLRGADLDGADLRGARLRGAKLQGVHYDRRTRWPAGFRPPAAGRQPGQR